MSRVEMTPGLFSQSEAPRNWKAPILLTVAGILVLVPLGLLGSWSQTFFRIADAGAIVAVPDLAVIPALLGIVGGVLVLAIATLSYLDTARVIRLAGWQRLSLYVLASVLFVTALVAWVGAGERIPVGFILGGALALSTPIVLGAMAGVISERVGVVNIAIEGQILAGAFVSAFVSSLTGSHVLGLFAALIGGSLVSLVLAVFSIKYLVDQIIVGVVLNALVIGITNFLFAAVLNTDAARFNVPGTLPSIAIPVLADIPVLGPLLFDQRLTVYLMFAIVPIVGVLLYKTRWGLRMRAVGEHPLAADTLGVNVKRTRFWSVTLAGSIAGLGGAALTIGSVGAFVREMSAGQGYIALAAVILGRWNPWLAACAALLFGFARNFRIWVGQTGAAIPPDLIAMVPYLVTLIAVAGLVGRVVGPAASGQPYVKG